MTCSFEINLSKRKYLSTHQMNLSFTKKLLEIIFSLLQVWEEGISNKYLNLKSNYHPYWRLLFGDRTLEKEPSFPSSYHQKCIFISVSFACAYSSFFKQNLCPFIALFFLLTDSLTGHFLSKIVWIHTWTLLLMKLIFASRIQFVALKWIYINFQNLI